MGMNATIVVSLDNLDWIKRNPAIFVNGLIGRMEQGECDPRPGYARWTGDSMPGVQVVSVDHSSSAVVIITGDDKGRRIVSTSGGRTFPSDEDALKAFAERLGFTVRKKSEVSSKTTSQGRGNNKKKRPAKKRID